MSNWIDGKTVIITGASGGIGKGLTLRLIRENNCFVIGVARSESKMKALQEELGEKSGNFVYRLFDVSEENKWDEFISFIEDNGYKPDVLINNAGILPRFDRLMNYSKDEIDNAMKINFFAPAYSVNKMLPILLKSSSPAVVNVSSSASLMSLAGTSIYSASKAALKGLTEAVREELRGEAYVGLVCPGFTKTDIFRNQTEKGDNDLIAKVSTPCEKTVDLIIKGIRRKKEYIVTGFDGNCMGKFGRLMPVKGSKIFSAVMKKSHINLFADTFGYEKK